MNQDFQSQAPYSCKLDWAIPGTLRAASRGDIIVLVDTLSFSTTTVHAVSLGARIYPCSEGGEAHRLASAIGGEAAVRRTDVPAEGRFSLCPHTFDEAKAGERVVLPSLNGATCSKYGKSATRVLVGALVNASAVATEVSSLLTESAREVTVIACGEREKQPRSGGDLRVAIEDYLAAGAIISRITGAKSPEARVCEAAFQGNAHNLAELLWESISGRELRDGGFEEDVVFAARLDAIPVVPVLRDGAFGLHLDQIDS